MPDRLRHPGRPPRIQPGIVISSDRAPPSSVPRLRFLGPLDELVALGLFRPAFEAFCRGSAEPVPTPIDREYLRKILREEAGRPAAAAVAVGGP